MSDLALDPVFKALADPSRRQLLDRLHARDGLTLVALCEGLDMSRQAVSQHLAVLVASDLIVVLKGGRERLHFLNPAPIQEITTSWINKFENRQMRPLAAIKARLDGVFDD